MKKSKDPLGWYFERSSLEGKVIKHITISNISYPVESFEINWTVSEGQSPSFWRIADWSSPYIIGSKKTLNITKKEDIKFV